MLKIKGTYITTHYYTKRIPFFSWQVFAQSLCPQSSFWYKTIDYPTRWIELQSDFKQGYTKRLQRYLRQSENMPLDIQRPKIFPEILDLFQSTMEAKNLSPYPPSILRAEDRYYYSAIYHDDYGLLAAHLAIGDLENHTVIGYINASNYRTFSDPKIKRLASIANNRLFDDDLTYFQSLGYEIYDMVGITEPLNQMKKQFGGKIVQTYTHIPRIILYIKKIKSWFSALRN